MVPPLSLGPTLLQPFGFPLTSVLPRGPTVRVLTTVHPRQSRSWDGAEVRGHLASLSFSQKGPCMSFSPIDQCLGPVITNDSNN